MLVWFTVTAVISNHLTIISSCCSSLHHYHAIRDVTCGQINLTAKIVVSESFLTCSMPYLFRSDIDLL